MLQPARTKYRKQMKGRMKGLAYRGSALAFGEYGLKALEEGRINARQIEVFNKEYKASPQSFTLGLEARTIWEGRGLGNLGRVGPWKLGKQQMSKPARDFSVQLGSWQEVGDALGVEGADDRIEPVETALVALASCVTEAITLNCARTGVDLKGLEVKTSVDGFLNFFGSFSFGSESWFPHEPGPAMP